MDATAHCVTFGVIFRIRYGRAKQWERGAAAETLGSYPHPAALPACFSWAGRGMTQCVLLRVGDEDTVDVDLETNLHSVITEDPGMALRQVGQSE